MMPKVILCGGSGLLGRSISKCLEKNNINFIGTYNKNKIENFIKIDFTDINEIEKYFVEIKPTVCISSIAQRLNEVCENDWKLTKKINIDIANNLAIICKKLNIFLIHISTDYVYDGQTPPFTPNSITNPLQNYGISKLIAEHRILACYGNDTSKFLILRVPVLYSQIQKNLNESAVTMILKKILNKVEVFEEDNFSIRRPVFIDDFSNFIVNKCLTNSKYYGIHCFYNSLDKYTKYSIAQLGGRLLNKSIENIFPLNDRPLFDTAMRPKDTQLYDQQVENDYVNITSLEQGLQYIVEKFYHPKINLEKKESHDIFLLIDLDGTLVDSEEIQWKSYRDALKEYNINYTFDKFTEICHNGDIKEYLIKNYNFSTEDYNSMKKLKKKNMLKYKKELKLIEGADLLIKYIERNNVNHCVVTNSSIETVKIYKEALPELNKLKNFIKREDYKFAKPSSECYFKALNIFYKKEKYIIGFENSLSGLESLKKVTKIIYFLTYKDYLFYNDVKKEDIYLIKNYNQL